MTSERFPVRSLEKELESTTNEPKAQEILRGHFDKHRKALLALGQEQRNVIATLFFNHGLIGYGVELQQGGQDTSEAEKQAAEKQAWEAHLHRYMDGMNQSVQFKENGIRNRIEMIKAMIRQFNEGKINSESIETELRRAQEMMDMNVPHALQFLDQFEGQLMKKIEAAGSIIDRPKYDQALQHLTDKKSDLMNLEQEFKDLLAQWEVGRASRNAGNKADAA